jgi:uncharacterized protein involved in outer membrane biogenesis
VLEDVVFQTAPWGSKPEMVKINWFEVHVPLLPLIRGNIKVRRLRLTDPEFLLEINKSGKSNMEFDVSEKPKPESDKEKDALEKLPIIAIKKSSN